MTEQQEKYNVGRSTKINHNGVLPQEFIQLLETFRDKDDTTRWGLADLLAEMDTELEDKGGLPRAQVGDVLGMLPSGVSVLIVTAQRISKELREQYAENVPFSWFERAARDKNPQELFDLAAKSADDKGGKWPPVRVVCQWVRKRKKGESPTRPPAKPTWTGRWHYDDRGTLWVLVDESEHQPTAGAAVTIREL